MGNIFIDNCKIRHHSKLIFTPISDKTGCILVINQLRIPLF